MMLESLARAITKARHGTDAHWENYLESARAVAEVVARRLDWLDEMASTREVGDSFDAEADYWWALLARPNSSDSIAPKSDEERGGGSL